jgi:hypothetical protein
MVEGLELQGATDKRCARLLLARRKGMHLEQQLIRQLSERRVSGARKP